MNPFQEADVDPVYSGSMELHWGGSEKTGPVAIPGIDSSTVVLVTGGSGSIGFRTAQAFSQLGARVAIMSRSKTMVDEAVERLGARGKAIGVTGDVSIEADAMRAVDATIEAFGRLDVLVNSAAIGGHALLEETDAETIDKMLAINVKGTLLMIRAAVAPMKAQGRGRIINISSVMGHRSFSGSFLYGSSKAAVGHATRSLAVELGPYGITVNCLSPANTPTQLRDVNEAPGTPTEAKGQSLASADKLPLRRRGDLDDYVGPILFFASDLSAYVTGADVLVDGGLSLLRA